MKNKKGFTIIELMVVIALIGILSTIVMAYLATSRRKGSDAKIKSQLGQMLPQGFLYGGALPGIGAAVGPTNTGIAGAAGVGTSPSQLFNATNSNLNSLYSLANGLPGGTYIYYGWNGGDPNLTGLWFFSAATSTGAFCVDNKGNKTTFAGTSPTTLSNFVAAFPNATIVGGYRCN